MGRGSAPRHLPGEDRPPGAAQPVGRRARTQRGFGGSTAPLRGMLTPGGSSKARAPPRDPCSPSSHSLARPRARRGRENEGPGPGAGDGS